jgi:hypothetical protein
MEALSAVLEALKWFAGTGVQSKNITNFAVLAPSCMRFNEHTCMMMHVEDCMHEVLIWAGAVLFRVKR